MTPAQDDPFELYESQYVRDLEGRLIRIEAATLKDLDRRVIITIDGQDVKEVPLAVPATDAQGNPLYDKEGEIIPRLTTVYDAVTWRYRDDAQAHFPGPDPKNPVPVLCHQHHQRPIGVCRVCSVLTVKDGRVGAKLIPACQHPLVPGKDASKPCMEIHTVESTVPVKAPGEKEPVPAGKYLERSVKVLVELLAANYLHHGQPADDPRYSNELLDLCKRFKIPTTPTGSDHRLEIGTAFRRRTYEKEVRIDSSSPVIHVDHNNCILCDRCARGCNEVRPFKIIGHTGFGNKARISFDLGVPMVDSGCVSCGECALSCPTGALTFKTSIYQDRNPWADEPLTPRTVVTPKLAGDRLFTGVSYAYLKWNEGAVGEVKARPQQELCRQNEYGSTAFLIREGEVEILFNGNVVARATPEKDFLVGELACLSHQPRRAALRAGPNGATVWVIKRNMLSMLQRTRAAREVLAPLYRERALRDYLRQGQLFSGLDPDQGRRCIEFLSRQEGVDFVQIDPRQEICRQGKRADSFYIIYLGNVSISTRNTHGHVQIRNYLGPGRQFGEIGLLSAISQRVANELPAAMRGRRTTTCTALDHVEVVRISEEAFAALLKSEPSIGERLEEKACQILEGDRQRQHDVRPLMTEFVTEGLYQGQSLLVLDLERCTRCQECVKACASSHDGVTRLILEGNRFDRYLVPSACRSCHDPACLTGCPVDAIHRKPAAPGQRSMAIFIENHCIGCGLCSQQCPFGSIHMLEVEPGRRMANTRKQVATNCDLCESLDGNPRCVHHCPHEAAMRMTGYQLAKRVDLGPAGSARDQG